MQIEATVSVWQVKDDDKGVSFRFSESKKNQETNVWEEIGSGWASAKKDAINVIRSLPAAQGTNPMGIIHVKGAYNGYNKKLADGSYGRGFFTVFEANLVGKQSQDGAQQTATQTAAPAQAQQAQPAQQPVQQATPEIDELPFS